MSLEVTFQSKNNQLNPFLPKEFQINFDPQNKNTIELDITIKIPEQRIADLLTGAFEGGSNYWIRQLTPDYVGIQKDVLKEWAQLHNFDHIYYDQPVYLAPFIDGCCVYITEIEPSGIPLRPVNRKTLTEAIAILAEKYPHHLIDIIHENDDATTSDVLLQLAVFGELIYG